MADVPGLVTYIAENLTDEGAEIHVTEVSKGRQRIVRLAVSTDDMGRVIGREGRIANAIRTLLKAVPGGERWGLEVASEEE